MKDYLMESTPLSVDLIRKAFEDIRDAPMRAPHGTPDNPHVIHPDSATKDGWYRCDCGMLPVHNGRVDWDWGLR